MSDFVPRGVAPRSTPPVVSETRGSRIQSSHGLSSFEPESTRGSLPDSQEGKYGGREHHTAHGSPVAGERAGGATSARSNGSLIPALDPPFVAETLAWCNEIRAEKGLPSLDRLPMGEREQPESCPCGRATGLYVDNETYGASRETFQAHPLPLAVIKFVEAFDLGKLPQYDETPPQEDEEW